MNQQTLKTVAERFASARKARKLKQEELAELAGVSVGTISNLENAKSLPQRRIRVALTEALGEDVFDDNLGESARLGWPEDVQVFTDVIGQYLASLTPPERSETVGRWMREIVASR